MLKEILNKST